MDSKVIIFDTTLRDGEQALNASLSVHEKLQIALAIERLGVDVMEVGFPVSSPGDFKSVQQIARTVKNSRVCALARAVEGDIQACADALKVADQFRIHTFISTSDVHVQQKLKKDFADVEAMAIHAVKFARRFTDDVEFSCEDAGRTPIDNLCRMVENAIKAGATTINIPDTVGYTLPNEFGGIITQLFNRVPNIDQAVISVHCHNDLGLAVANSMSAVQAGARQIECTINGIGERALPYIVDGESFPGLPGQDGLGPNPGTGGPEGPGYENALSACLFIVGQCTAPVSSYGQLGVDAIDGTDGIVGLDGVPTHLGGFFVPGDGDDGLNGEDGSGGGGGGGSGSHGDVLNILGLNCGEEERGCSHKTGGSGFPEPHNITLGCDLNETIQNSQRTWERMQF